MYKYHVSLKPNKTFKTNDFWIRTQFVLVIKIYRMIANCSLKEAKDAVEQLSNQFEFDVYSHTSIPPRILQDFCQLQEKFSPYYITITPEKLDDSPTCVPLIPIVSIVQDGSMYNVNIIRENFKVSGLFTLDMVKTFLAKL